MKELDDNIYNLKREILTEVARISFKGTLNEESDKIPYKIIPGSTAKYRCCVYKEREIISQRVRMICGKKPLPKALNDKNDLHEIIHVIDTACEECPISRFIVTENCQNCLSKRCKSVCKFNAISLNGKRVHIDKNLCKECGRCKDVCPFNAIADLMRPCIKSCPVKAISEDEQKKAVIDYSKCIHCGNCVVQCPFGAISDVSYIVDVIELLKSSFKTYALVAPAIEEGQFGNSSFKAIETAILGLGFEGVYQAAEGAELVAEEEAHLFKSFIEENKYMTSSCCPSFVELINKHFPQLKNKLSPSVSPMIKTAEIIKNKHPEAKIIFIGPCISKKLEIINSSMGKLVDYVITFEELFALFKAKSLVPVESEEKFSKKEPKRAGQKICKSGGLSEMLKDALLEVDASMAFDPLKCNGVKECKKSLLLAQKNKLDKNFIEGMICEKGCIGGPAVVKT